MILDNGRTSSTKWSKKFNPYQSCIIGIMNRPHFHQARVWNGHNDIICDKKTALSFSALDTYFCKSTANVFHFHACRVAINTSRQFFFLSVAHNQNLNSDKFTNISCKQSSIIICTVWMTSSCDYPVRQYSQLAPISDFTTIDINHIYRDSKFLQIELFSLKTESWKKNSSVLIFLNIVL